MQLITWKPSNDPVVASFVAAFQTAQFRPQTGKKNVRAETPDQFLAIQPPFPLASGAPAAEHVPFRIGTESRIQVTADSPFVYHPKGIRNKVYAATMFHVLILFTRIETSQEVWESLSTP